jgi:hypothetical protein
MGRMKVVRERGKGKGEEERRAKKGRKCLCYHGKAGS